ncbi:MAG: CBS domain-containing protein [Archangium sp.]|nr:CBS domain-containing protein [Archangium sp.]
MTPSPIVILPSETLQGAMELMARKRVRHLPVVDGVGQLLGLVSDRDLRRAAPSPIFSPDSNKAEEQMDHTTVERIMVRSPSVVTSTSTLKAAVQLLVEKKFGALPVVDGGKLVGIITPIDLMKLWLKSQPA